jgi:serine/threonine-protein kinase
MLGTVFAGHRIETVLGRGGMGVVYRARHCRLGRVAALKVMAPELLEDASAHRRFREEAAVAAAIEHPNIVPVHDAGEADGMAYLTMRYVCGADLFTMVRGCAPLAPPQAAAIVADVGDALDALHGAGYVHRDVKPRNVLIGRDGHVFLSDFGLARPVAGENGAECNRAGTIDYAAPEQIRGGRADARADVYGLGCLLFFALTRRAPFARETVQAKLRAHLHDPPPAASALRSDVTPAMDEVIARAMAKEPCDRFATAGDLGRAALAAAGGRPGRERLPVAAVAAARPAVDASTVSCRAAAARPGPMTGPVAVT